jgi:hypothetical protein
MGVRCGFPLKRNTNSLFVQAKFKKNHTLTTNPPPQTPLGDSYLYYIAVLNILFLKIYVQKLTCCS